MIWKPSLLLAMLLLATAASAKVAVTTKTIARKSGNLEIAVRYPATGRPAIDRLLADYARARAAEVRPADAASDPGHTYSVHVAYRVTRNDDKFFAVFFSGDDYTGGAHPNPFEESFVFLMPDGARTFLPELVNGRRGLDRISRLAIADLNKRLLGPNSMSQPDWIKGGAGPAALAHAAFQWQPTELVLTFGAYAVAAYAAGRQEVHIPMAAIADVVRADPRAPMPSFDCKGAATKIEKTLCADAALARRDRVVAQAYADALAANADSKAQAALLAAQRGWLKARNQSCANADPVCLSKFYQRRLAALQPPSP